ncbi:MAG: hypothetical protein OEY58_16725 [Gammaproteobacteria bacterium]|nr:hypothetical protein [Gammaproteobacteria bacterium]
MGSRPVKLIDPIKGITTSRTPISLGLAFLVVAVGLYGLAIFTAPDDPPLDYISFSENISWPLSIVLLFPVVIALTQSFYQQIPLVFSRLAASQKDSTEFHSFGTIVGDSSTTRSYVQSF